MNIIITGRHIEVTNAIREKVNSKLKKLESYIDPNTDVKVTVRAKNDSQTIEITIKTINGPVIRAEQTEIDLYSAIDLAYDKLKYQIRKYKKRLQDKKQDNKSIRFLNLYENYEDLENEQELIVERRKRFSIKPMNEEEAIMQMDLLGHVFYMFRNMDTDQICVVYKRKSGNYGIIEQD